MAKPVVKKIRGKWLRDPDLVRVLACLTASGGDARIAGGAVRNALLKKPIVDIDIATPVLPKDVMQRAKAAGLGVHPTGLAHGTITLTSNKRPFEVTTLRRDVQTDGRRAIVAFTRDWAEDAQRRDFTINAMYCDMEGNIYDYSDCYKDILIPRVKFVGRPEHRIHEDYLRILRFFRFHAQYGRGAPDAAGLEACKNLKRGLKKLSKERIRQELLKLLTAPRAVPTLKLMATHGILAEIIPYTDNWKMLERLPEDSILRLFALSAQPHDLQTHLKLSNTQAERIKSLSKAPTLSPELRMAERHRLLYHLGAENWRDAVHLSWARSKAPLSDRKWQSLMRLAGRWGIPKFPVTGQDLIKQGLVPGPALGETLRWLEDWWIASNFKLSKEQLLAKGKPND